MRRETRAWMARAAAATLLAGTLGYVPYHLYTRSGLARTIELGHDLVAVRAENAGLAAENVRLLRDIEAMRMDPAAVERVARHDLGWVKPGEVLFQIEAAPRGDEGGGAGLASVSGSRSW